MGTQECKGDGSSWSVCECKDQQPASPVDVCDRKLDPSEVSSSDTCPKALDAYSNCQSIVLTERTCIQNNPKSPVFCCFRE